MMRNNKILQYLFIIFTAITLFSCDDKIDFSSQIPGEGESMVEASLRFKTNVTNLGSRSSGTAISSIESLHIVIYRADEEKSFFKLINNVDFTIDKDSPTSSTPSDYPTEEDKDGNIVDKTTEKATQQVRFNMSLPYGKYYMYAVANLGRDLEEGEVVTIDDLKSIQCNWDLDHPMNYNPENTESQNKQINAQMFGYFTNIDKEEDPNKYGSAFDKEDPIVVVNRPSIKLHSWIKRLASKVTIAFDGKNLHENIIVYIHNVSIRQIPLKCYLGKDNNPQENEVTSAYFDESIPKGYESQVLYYNTKGVTDQYSKYEPTAENSQKWMAVAKGTGVMGSKDHTNTDPALFFYENMKGVHPTYLKPQQPDSVGSNVGPGDEGYQDDIKYGTFIEVEAYYDCGIVPISEGPIRYRFMLGQNTKDDYNAARNSHYKLTLGFNGYANQPDWHIEYKEPIPEIYAQDVYIPYTYNTAVKFPIRATGDPVSIDVELIENNWGPYDLDNQSVPPAYGGYPTNFDNRLLEFNWNKTVYDNNSKESDPGYKKPLNFPTNATSIPNSTDNYLYGRHKSSYKHLKVDGSGEVETNNDDDFYYVTPIWAGFLRLLQPTDFQDEDKSIPPTLELDGDDGSGNSYSSLNQLKAFRDYYIACPKSDTGAKNLGKRTFNISEPTEDKFNRGRNAYEVIREHDADGKTKGVSVIMNLWTQPKSMCGISGFSGNNPYEDYVRKGVMRITAKYKDKDKGEYILMKDVTVYQTERLVNPKAIWRSHELQKEGDEIFNVILYKRDSNFPSKFEEVISQGDWKATIKETEGFDGFISIGSSGNRTVTGSTLSAVKFPIIFEEKSIGYKNSKCAIIEIRYHGNTCVHNIYVRQGFHQPLQIVEGGTYWSSYNLYSCGGVNDNDYDDELKEVNATFTYNPIAFGSYFKRGNYYQAMTAHNISYTNLGFGPLGDPGDNAFELADRSEKKSWGEIEGNTDMTWKWADKFIVSQTIMEEENEYDVTRTYRMPKLVDFEALQNQEFGIGVLYCNGAKEPSTTTKDAYGFLANSNDKNTISSTEGMRGIICYNPKNANQVFFPIGTTGMGRRNIESGVNGTLLYSSVTSLLKSVTNCMRPLAYNTWHNAGSIYWMYDTPNNNQPAWDMNYTDLNFNQYAGRTLTAPSGDALPIRLVIDNPGN